MNKMIEEKDVLPFAKAVARSYCSLSGSWNNYDDAVGESCVFLLEHREFWIRPTTWLKRRVIGQLIRNYQNERGLRRKHKTTTNHVDESLIAPQKDKTDSNKVDERNRIIDRALQQPDVAQDSAIIRDILGGVSREEVAKKYKITQGRVSQLFHQFRIACLRLDVDTIRRPTTEEKERYPLLYGIESDE